MITPALRPFLHLLLLHTALLFSIASQANASTEAPAQSEDSWTINMQSAEIRDFIEQISSISGQTFIIDPRVKGQVTVIAQQPMNIAEVYKLFLSVMSTHGFAVMPQGNQLSIIPSSEAKTTAGSRGNLETRVLQVQHGAANDLLPLGYEVVIFEQWDKPGGLMRTNIPSFRLPEAVLAEEIGYIEGMGAEIRRRLELQASNERRAWLINRLALTMPEGSFVASGAWGRALAGLRGTRETRLDFAIDTEDAGKLLDRLGHAGSRHLAQRPYPGLPGLPGQEPPGGHVLQELQGIPGARHGHPQSRGETGGQKQWAARAAGGDGGPGAGDHGGRSLVAGLG